MQRLNVQHHYQQGYKHAMKGKPRDKRKRHPAHAQYYRRGWCIGRRDFEAAALHGMQQKIADSFCR